MKKLVVLAIVLATAACGPDDPKLAPDGSMTPDTPNPEQTFTSYVIELVKNQTNDTATARPYAEFSSLPDPDMDNAAAYATLF